MMSSRTGAALVLSLCMLLMPPSALLVSSFQPAARTTVAVPSPLTPAVGRPGYIDLVNHRDNKHTTGSSTSLYSFMGSDGGLFGIGTPELATILLVGYFVLGPSELYKLVKEVGKFIQNVRTLGTEATKNFEDSMESQLDLTELRNAQRELNDAFSFRRSINVDDGSGAFSTNAQSPRPQDDIGAPVAAAATATATADDTTAAEATAEAPKRKKKKRRRVKKKVQPEPEPAVAMEAGGAPINNVPDLDMSEAFPKSSKEEKKEDWFTDDDAKDYNFPSASEMAKEDMEWLKDSETTTTPAAPAIDEKDPAADSTEQSRFQQQLRANWNEQVLDNEDKLAPLALVMEKLALLEEEKNAADKRLEDEFRKRFQQEEDFYQEKRELLEETATKVQQDAYVTMDSGSTKK